MTPRELIRSWASLFEGAGVPDPLVDASLLLSHVTGQPALSLRLDSVTEMEPAVEASMRRLCERRLAREPLQYILGDQPFMGHSFLVSPAVLIPRMDTERLCTLAIDALQKAPAPRTLLDLCCGSGCIGLSVKLALPEAEVVCTDISEEALETARRNAERLGAVVRFVRGDLFRPVSGRFRAIVSNPPYIPSAVCEALQPEVMREPKLALDGGADGLRFHRQIASQAADHLLPSGSLLLEIGFDQADAVAALLREAGFAEIAVAKDDGGLDRVVTARAPGGMDEGTV